MRQKITLSAFLIKSTTEVEFDGELSVNYNMVGWLFLVHFNCSNSVYLISIIIIVID